MSKKSNLTEEDQATFRQAMRNVKPIKQTKTLPKPVSPPPPRKRKVYEEKEIITDEFSDHENLPSVGSEDILQFFRPGIQHKILRNLRNGKYNVEATLDLHGQTVVEARESLSQFLAACARGRIRHALIIHGKGKNSNKPILKNKLNHWLRQTEQVLAFCSATIREGRGGALYVLLKF